MNVLIIGNLGYIGPVLTNFLLDKKHKVSGIDTAFFSNNNNNKINQIYLDVRHKIKNNYIKNFDAIIYLAAISNDPMGSKFQKQTNDINCLSAINIARFAKKNGVKKFIFASSCSVYGKGGKSFKTEQSQTKPLTAYAKSKIYAEKKLKKIASATFKVICLRFATACGFSKNIRLDLVLNDFVASAIINKKIEVLSNGMPWRPIIHVKDMARAMEWAIKQNVISKNFIFLNTGNTSMNLRVKDLAKAVSKHFPTCKLLINSNAPSDSRSYRVNFSKYEKLSNHKKPLMNLNKIIAELKKKLKTIKLSKNFRKSKYIRLVKLNKLIKLKKLNRNLEWI